MLVVVGALGILEDGLPVVREVDDDGGRLAVALEDLRDDLVIVVDGVHIVADDATALGVGRSWLPVGERLRQVVYGEGRLLVDVAIGIGGMRAHQVHDLEEIFPCGSLRTVKEQREDIAIGRGIPVASRADAHEACAIGRRGERRDGLDTRALLLLIADPVGIVACLREHEGQCGVLVPLLLRTLEGVEAHALRDRARRPGCRRDGVGEEDEVARPDKRVLLRGILQWIAVAVHIVAPHGFAEDDHDGDALHITCMLDSTHIEVACIRAVLSQ